MSWKSHHCITDAEIEQLGTNGLAIIASGVDKNKFAAEDFTAALLEYGLRVLIDPKELPKKKFHRDDEKSIIFGG